MFRFAKSLINYELIDERRWNDITKPHVAELAIGSAKRHYGYLFQILEQNGIRIVGHSGGAAGMSTIMELYPDHDDIVMFFLILVAPRARNVSEHIKELIRSNDSRRNS